MPRSRYTLLRHHPPTAAGQTAATLVSSLLTSANLSSFAWGSQCALGARLEPMGMLAHGRQVVSVFLCGYCD
eukprot:COSAG01_NODE_2474_length_7623_cov_9.861111_8_plen_72_part_00